MSVNLGKVPPKGYVTWAEWFNNYLKVDEEVSFSDETANWRKTGANQYQSVMRDGMPSKYKYGLDTIVGFAPSMGVTYHGMGHPLGQGGTINDAMAGISYLQAQALLTWINKKVEDAYATGYEDGRADGYDQGYDEGRDY